MVNTRILRLVGLLLVLPLYPVVNFYLPKWLIDLLQEVFPTALFRLDNLDRHMAFTFDDGPNPPYTEAILDILRQHDIKATFFVRGQQAQKHPDTLRRIKDEGHQVCNHFFSHTPTILYGKQRFLNSLLMTESLIQQTTSPKYLRPASTWFRPWALDVANEFGYKIVLGSAYAADAWRPPRWYIRWALKRMLRPGVITVLHDGVGNRQRAVDVLPQLIQETQRRQLAPVTVDQLFHSHRAISSERDARDE